MSEEKTKVLIPFRQPITITNPTQPGEEEGEVVPVPIHIIVDNAADFPSGGGGGGNVKHVVLPATFAGAVEGMCDETTEFMVVIGEPDSEDPGNCFIMLSSSVGLETSFVVEPDTPYVMLLHPNSGTMTFDSQIGVTAHDEDNDVDLTSVCFPYDEDNNRYAVNGNNSVVIQFSIPSSAGAYIKFEFGGQK